MKSYFAQKLLRSMLKLQEHQTKLLKVKIKV